MEIFKLYKGTVSIGFEEREWNGNKVHKYTKENGDVPLSVTKVTGTIDKSPFLIPWAIRLMGEYLIETHEGKPVDLQMIEIAKKKWREAKEEAADIGSAVHDWIEQHIKGKNPAMPENEKVINCVNAYLKWEKENKIKWIVNEGLVYSKKYDYVGKLDAIGKIGGKTFLIDYKSSKSIYEEFYLQTAGYQLAYEEEHGKCIDGRILLHLGKEDGVFEHREIGDYEKDKKAFIGLLATKKRLEELKKEIKEHGTT